MSKRHKDPEKGEIGEQIKKKEVVGRVWKFEYDLTKQKEVHIWCGTQHKLGPRAKNKLETYLSLGNQVHVGEWQE